MKESEQREYLHWLVRWRQEEFVHRFIPLTSIQLLKTECRLRSELPGSQSRNGNVYSSKVTILWALKRIMRTVVNIVLNSSPSKNNVFYTILSYSIPRKKPRVLSLKGEYQQWQLKYILFSFFSLVRINGKHSLSQ